MVGAQPSQAGLDRAGDVLAAVALVPGPAARGVVALRGQHDVVALASHPPADDVLGRADRAERPAQRVHVGGVDEGDALLEGGVEDGERRVVVTLEAEGHGAEAEPGHDEAGAAEVGVLHGVTVATWEHSGPGGYPRPAWASDRWESDVVLADGGTVHVRPIRPDDAERLVAFHGRLAPESVYFRFFSPKPRLTDKEVEKFTTVDMDGRVALVALLHDDIVAVARYDRWPGRDEAEVAFTVADEHHGRGLATLLLEHLAAIAPTKGINRFTAEVLPDNRSMLGVFRRGRVRGAQRVLRRDHRRRLRHRADGPLPRDRRPARAAGREPFHRSAPEAPFGGGHRRVGPPRAPSAVRSSATCSTSASTAPSTP